MVPLEQGRLSLRILPLPPHDVIDMGTTTVPITEDISPLLRDPYNPSRSGSGIPSSYTRLQ